MTQEDMEYRIKIMQERAGYEGVAIALPPNYTECDVDDAGDELSFVISGYRPRQRSNMIGANTGNVRD